MNVFVTPGEVFEEVKTSAGCAANWLVPVVVSCVVAVAAVWTMFSQETILHQVQEQQERVLEKKLEQMPKEQREQVREAAAKFSNPAMLKTFGSFGAVVWNFAWLFGLALGVWALGRLVFKAPFPYAKALEVCGLAAMINVLNGVVTTLLIVGLGSLYATPGPALVIRDFDPTNKVHLLAGACNVITFWYMAVLAVGLGKLSGAPAWKPFAWFFGAWAAVRAGLILAGVGQGT